MPIDAESDSAMSHAEAEEISLELQPKVLDPSVGAEQPKNMMPTAVSAVQVKDNDTCPGASAVAVDQSASSTNSEAPTDVAKGAGQSKSMYGVAMSAMGAAALLAAAAAAQMMPSTGE